MNPPPDDPRRGHPGFTDTDPPPPIRRQMGAPIIPPRVPPPIIVEREERAPVSQRVAQFTRDAGIRVPVSLGFIGAIALGAYQLGAQKAADASEVAKAVESAGTKCEAQRLTCEAQRTACDSAFRSATVTESSVRNIDAQLGIISSKLERK